MSGENELNRRLKAHRGLTTRGFGADRPLGKNTSEHGRARNRRVELALQLLVRDAPSPNEKPESA